MEKKDQDLSVETLHSSEKNVDATGDEVAEVAVVDHALERRICRKFDMRILPLIAVMYLFNSLDKGNISNAKTDGIDEDLGIHGQQWNNMLMIFYIPYCLCGFPLSIVIRKYQPARVIPIMMFCFGSVTLLAVSVFNYGSIVATRWFLGVFESAFFPGIIYYLSTFYRRDELARRLSVFYAASNISNAFSGLLAFGVFQIDTERLHGWQILFLIEGGCTVLVAVLAFFYLPKTVESVKFLTEEERKCAVWRIKVDASAGPKEKMVLSEAIKVYCHPVSLLWVLQFFCLCVPLNSINNWFPQIIGSFGKGKVMTNLYTVAPNVWGAVALLILCFTSDFTRVRSIPILIALISTLLGFVVFRCVNVDTQLGAAYFSCFLMTTGTSAASVLTSTWFNNNIPDANKRLIFSSITIPLGNSAGLISSNIFRAKDAPKYVPALGVTAGFGGLSALCAITVLGYMIIDNKRRNRAQEVNWTYRDVPTYLLGDGPNSPNYRWMY